MYVRVSGRPYFSVCTIYRDQAQYLEEWIEFHRLVGAERFFLYNNNSTDNHREVLAPYLDDGIVVLHDWPVRFPAAVPSAFTHCLEEHREDSRWIAFIDLDEFLFSPQLVPVTELLPEYERHSALCVVELDFGTSGHISEPPGLVTENYLHRWNPPETSAVKCIVDPTRTRRAQSAHRFAYYEGCAVDELHRPIKGQADDAPPTTINMDGWTTTTPSFEKLRINHYWSMSEEAALRKLERWNEGDQPRPLKWVKRQIARRNDVRDDLITHYVPALREALARRGR